MDILTPFQQRILTAIGHSDLASSFYLTGGTALAVYHLQHRYSEDLDFFADAREAMTGVTSIASEIAQELDAQIEFTRTFPTFVETFLTTQAGERVKIDFAFDTPFRLQPTTTDPAYGIRPNNPARTTVLQRRAAACRTPCAKPSPSPSTSSTSQPRPR